MANTELFPLYSEQPASKNMQKIIQQYSKYWYIFVASILLCTSLAYFYVHYYAIPQFKVYSTVLIKDDKSDQASFSVDAVADLGKLKSKNIDNEIEIFKSKSLMSRVIEELGLTTSYYIAGRLHNTELFNSTLPIKIIPIRLYPSAISKILDVYVKPNNSFELVDDDGSRGVYQFGQQIKKPYGIFTIITANANLVNPARIIIKLQSTQQVANYYNQAISVQPVNRNTSVLVVSLVDALPNKAELIINKLIEVYKKEAYEDKNMTATSTINFLDNRLRYLASDLSSVEKSVEKYKSSNSLIDINSQADSYTDQANKYNSQIAERSIQLAVLESIEEYLKSKSSSNSTIPSTLDVDNEVLSNLISKFNELQLEKFRLERNAQPNNPIVQNVEEQLATLRTNILENLRSVRRSLQITTNNLKESSNSYQNKIRKIPGMERELLDINRQKAIKQNIYSYLLQKREEAALSLAATTSIARTIDPAITIPYPVNINTQVLYLLSIILGMAIPFSGIYVSNLLNNKVKSQQDIALETKVPIIGEVARNDSKKHIVATSNNRTAVAESFRIIRANLGSAANANAKCLTILVTSGSSEEGKTFFSVNLSASLMLTGKKVVLLNLDLHNPNSVIEDYLLDNNDIGVTDYLANDNINIEDIIRYSDSIPGLAVISARPNVISHIELISSQRIDSLIKSLKNDFDYVIIDTPPVGQVADAFALNNLIDFTMYMVRCDYTPKSALAVIESIRANKTLKSPFIVLNDIKKSDNSYAYSKTRKNYRQAPKSIS